MQHQIVSRDEWLAARKAQLAREKEFTRQRDRLSAERRRLPWVRVERGYRFDGPDGQETLADLFAGRSQLIVYHFMFGPGWEEGCKSCSFLADHFDGSVVHLAKRDVTLVAVSRAPLARDRRRSSGAWAGASSGCRPTATTSTATTMSRSRRTSWPAGEVYYNYARGPFPAEEAPGASVFYKDAAGAIFHTYSAYARGLDILVGAYNFLDLAPKGRDEDGLDFTMEWVRHHDRYDNGHAGERPRAARPRASRSRLLRRRCSGLAAAQVQPCRHGLRVRADGRVGGRRAYLAGFGRIRTGRIVGSPRHGRTEGIGHDRGDGSPTAPW